MLPKFDKLGNDVSWKKLGLDKFVIVFVKGLKCVSSFADELFDLFLFVRIFQLSGHGISNLYGV